MVWQIKKKTMRRGSEASGPALMSSCPPSSSRDSETSRDQQTLQTPSAPPEVSPGPAPTGKTPTSTAAHLQPAESSSRSDGADRTRTRTSTRAPIGLQPQQLIPTEPPFIGDTYLSEDTPPLTVRCTLWGHSCSSMGSQL